MLEVLAHPDEVSLYALTETLAFRGIARVQLAWEKRSVYLAKRAFHMAPLVETRMHTRSEWISETVRAIQLRAGRA